MNFNVEIIGLLAGSLTTISFVLQVYKTWKTKSAENLSLSMFMVYIIGISLWFTYGLEIHSISMIISNTITAILSFTLIYFKFRYRDREHRKE